MAKLNVWIPALAIVILGMAAPDLAIAMVKKDATAASTQAIADKAVKSRAGRVDDSISTCRMFGSDGLTPRPSLTHMKQSDHARIRAEYDLIRMAHRGNGDEAVYYRSLSGDSADNPKFNRYRAADRLGMKKGCKPHWPTP